jgi:hypothetical protein
VATIHTTDEAAGVHVSAQLRQQGYSAKYSSHYRETSRGEWDDGETVHYVTVQLCSCRKRSDDEHPGAMNIYTEWYDY